MSSRVAEKERRRQQRVEREQAAQRAERRARARSAIVAGGVAALAIGGTGKLHVEGLELATLGQVFSIRGVASQHRLGPHRATANKTMRMWVDGKPSDAFGAQRRDGQRVVVSYGPKNAPALGGIER